MPGDAGREIMIMGQQQQNKRSVGVEVMGGSGGRGRGGGVEAGAAGGHYTHLSHSHSMMSSSDSWSAAIRAKQRLHRPKDAPTPCREAHEEEEEDRWTKPEGNLSLWPYWRAVQAHCRAPAHHRTDLAAKLPHVVLQHRVLPGPLGPLPPAGTALAVPHTVHFAALPRFITVHMVQVQVEEEDEVEVVAAGVVEAGVDAVGPPSRTCCMRTQAQHGLCSGVGWGMEGG